MTTDYAIFKSFLDIKTTIEDSIKGFLLGYTISKGKEISEVLYVKGYRKQVIKRLTIKTLYQIYRDKEELINKLLNELPEDNSIASLHLAFREYYNWLEKKLVKLTNSKEVKITDAKEYEQALEEVFDYLNENALRLAEKIEKEILNEILPKKLAEVSNRSIIIDLYSAFSTLAKALKSIKDLDNWSVFLALVLMIRILRVLDSLDNEEKLKKEVNLMKEADFLLRKELVKEKKISKEFEQLLKDLVSVENEQ
jgi:hypothetical protein